MNLSILIEQPKLAITAEAVALAVLGLVIWIGLGVVSRSIRGWTSTTVDDGVDYVRALLGRLLLLATLLLVLADAVANAWLLTVGINPAELKLSWIEQVPTDLWVQFGTSIGQVLALMTGTVLFNYVVSRLLTRLGRKLIDTEWLANVKDGIAASLNTLSRSVRSLAWLLCLVLTLQLLQTPPGWVEFAVVALECWTVISAGVLLYSLAALLMQYLAQIAEEPGESALLRSLSIHKTVLSLLQQALNLIVIVGVFSILLTQIQFASGIAQWGATLIRIIGIAFVSRGLGLLVGTVIDEVLIQRPNLTEDEQKRRLTLVPFLQTGGRISIYLLGAVLVFNQLGIDTAPLIAGGALIGFTLGIGSYKQVSDIVSGFLLLFEGDILVGDYVCIGGIEGQVTSVRFRTLEFRDDEGKLHIVRNGPLDNIVKYDPKWTLAVVLIPVSYDADINIVQSALREVGAWSAAHLDGVTEPLQFEGVERFGDVELVLRTSTGVLPGRQSEVARRLRHRIKEVFDQRGIELPSNQRLIIAQDGNRPGAIVQQRRSRWLSWVMPLRRSDTDSRVQS